jgi:prepilin-type N-terminal cleavage/methylation domain-containing protein
MIARVRGRLAESGGYTLSEMIVVLAILLVVVGALAQLFESAGKAQTDMSNRFQAQQNARLALDKLRQEIHCASDAAQGTDGTALATAAYSSVRLTLPGYCPTNPTASTATPVTAYATWCTALVSTGRYQLWRYITTNPAAFVPTCGVDVTGATKVQWGDYLTLSNVFPTYVAPQGGSTWAANTAYAVNQLVRPSNTAATPYLFSVTTAGTSAAAEPIWPTTPNATVTDNTVTFKNIGGLTFGLGQLGVDLPVDLTPTDSKQRYDLQDTIVLRNTQR